MHRGIFWMNLIRQSWTKVHICQTATGSPSSHYHLENRATDNYRCSLGLENYYMDKFSFPLGLAVHPKQTLIRLTLKQQTEVDLFLVCSSGVDYYWCFLLFAWNSFSSYGCFSFRRLHTLNKCASMKLDVNLPKKKVSVKIFLLLQLWQVKYNIKCILDLGKTWRDIFLKHFMAQLVIYLFLPQP